MKKQIALALATLFLASCASLETMTPEDATRGAEAARAWLEVVADAQTLINRDK